MPGTSHVTQLTLNDFDATLSEYNPGSNLSPNRRQIVAEVMESVLGLTGNDAHHRRQHADPFSEGYVSCEGIASIYCYDDNGHDNDGCSQECTVETGYECTNNQGGGRDWCTLIPELEEGSRMLGMFGGEEGFAGGGRRQTEPCVWGNTGGRRQTLDGNETGVIVRFRVTVPAGTAPAMVEELRKVVQSGNVTKAYAARGINATADVSHARIVVTSQENNDLGTATIALLSIVGFAMLEIGRAHV